MTSNNGDSGLATMVFHSGEFIQDELISRRSTLEKLQCNGWDEPKLRKLLDGLVPVDHILADHISIIWGMKPSFWSNLQKMWDAFPDRREIPPKRS